MFEDVFHIDLMSINQCKGPIFSTFCRQYRLAALEALSAKFLGLFSLVAVASESSEYISGWVPAARCLPDRSQVGDFEITVQDVRHMKQCVYHLKAFSSANDSGRLETSSQAFTHNRADHASPRDRGCAADGQ